MHTHASRRTGRSFRRDTPLAAALATAALWIASGCAASRTDGEAAPAVGPSVASVTAPGSFAALTVLDGRTGEPVSWETLVERCAAAHAVLIGEEHDLAPAQAMAADLFAAIVARRPGAALSLEFFERDEQVHLDDYLAGLTTEEQFRAATGRRAGNYPDGHRAMVEAAREAGVPIVAANAPRRYVRLSRLEGYDRLRALSPGQRALFTIPAVMPSGRYHSDFIALMTGMTHATTPPAGQAGPQPTIEQRRSAAEATFRAQALWDSTMADSIARTLRDGRRPVVHVIGRFHTDHEGGTVQLLRRARPAARLVTLSCQRSSAASLRPEDQGRADFVIYAPPAAHAEREANAGM